MSDKQIFAAVEVADSEVRLIVGEFFNTRFNIIKVEKVPCSGMTFNEVTDPDAIITALHKACADVKKMLGAEIRKVILAMPSYRLKRYSLQSSVNVEGIDQVVTIQDVRNAVHKAERAQIPGQYALLQAVCQKYTVNGVTTRKIPLGEHTDKLTADIDLLCADRKVSFDLVGAVEKAGLSVLDIFPDVFAIGKETALLQASMDKQVIILKVGRTATTLGYLHQGRVASAAVLPAGLGTLASGAVEKDGLKSEMAVELLKYSVRLGEDQASENPIHIWSDGQQTHTVNEREFVESIHENLEKWLDAIDKTCVPILQAGETTVIITDEGGETQGLSDLVARRLGCECRCYIPETLGGRNAGLTACLGLFYAYQDKLPITGYIEDSLDMDAFVKAVSYRENTPALRKQETANKEDTLTNKLKGLFLEGKK